MKVVMLLFKDIHYDARVQREALALAEAGHDVVIACLEEYTDPPPTLHERVTLFRCKLTTKRLKRQVSRGSEASETGMNGGTAGHSGNGTEARRHGWRRGIVRLARNPVLKLAKDVFAARQYQRFVRDYIDEHGADVIHCHDLNTLPIGSVLAKRFHTDLVYDSHELYNEMAGKNALEKKAGYMIERRLFPRVDHLIVVNPYVADIFADMYGSKPTTVIQNTPVLPDSLPQKSGAHGAADDSQPNYWREKYSLAADDVLLLYQGGLTPERGIELCIDALTHLPETYKLILLGDGRMKDELKQQVEGQGLQTRVFMHDAVAAGDVLHYTAQADVGLVMYENTCQNNYYSTPNKVFEYMLAGIPTVSSDHPGKRYVVTDEQTGICVDENAPAIAEGIRQVMETYAAYVQRCIEKREHFSWQVEQKKLVHMYAHLQAEGAER